MAQPPLTGPRTRPRFPLGRRVAGGTPGCRASTSDCAAPAAGSCSLASTVAMTRSATLAHQTPTLIRRVNQEANGRSTRPPPGPTAEGARLLMFVLTRAEGAIKVKLSISVPRPRIWRRSVVSCEQSPSFGVGHQAAVAAQKRGCEPSGRGDRGGVRLHRERWVRRARGARRVHRTDRGENRDEGCRASGKVPNRG